jgi:hypothetical protein
MPVLDAKALETDPEGMELLRAVLQSGRRRKPAPPPRTEGQALADAIRRPAPRPRKPMPTSLIEASH